MKFIVSLLFVLTLLSGWSQDNTLQCLFVGDVMQHGGQLKAAYNKNSDSYDYHDCFRFVRPVIQQADLAIANLEVTHAGKPYKGYPQFSAPPSLSEALVNAGFNLILTANNHSCDGGAKGVRKTLDVLDKLGVRHTGTFRNRKERDSLYPLIWEEQGMRIAVLNYTYGTNGLKVPAPLIINYIDTQVMIRDFARAKALKADWIICTLHWGSEYKPLPDAYQKKWERFCYDQGADMVVGGHPHVLQPIVQQHVGDRDRMTVWSLGNFVSNQRTRYRDGGVMVRANLSKKAGKVSIASNDYVLTWVHPRQESSTKPYYILPDFDYNRHFPGFLNPEELSKSKQFYEDSRKLYRDHGKGVQEFKVGQDTTLVEQYERMLGEHYTVVLETSVKPSFKTKVPAVLQEEFYQLLKHDGTYALTYGVFKDAKKAFGEARFLKDAGLNPIGVFLVDPKTRDWKIKESEVK